MGERLRGGTRQEEEKRQLRNLAKGEDIDSQVIAEKHRREPGAPDVSHTRRLTPDVTCTRCHLFFYLLKNRCALQEDCVARGSDFVVDLEVLAGGD